MRFRVWKFTTKTLGAYESFCEVWFEQNGLIILEIWDWEILQRMRTYENVPELSCNSESCTSNTLISQLDNFLTTVKLLYTQKVSIVTIKTLDVLFLSPSHTHQWATIINPVGSKLYHWSQNSILYSSETLMLRLHCVIYRPVSIVLMVRYRASLKAIRYESTSLHRIVADKSHRVIVA